ncbi:MAG: hypothetical protein ABIA04_03470 [Pseudomonadota bacterium]
MRKFIKIFFIYYFPILILMAISCNVAIQATAAGTLSVGIVNQNFFCSYAQTKQSGEQYRLSMLFFNDAASLDEIYDADSSTPGGDEYLYVSLVLSQANYNSLVSNGSASVTIDNLSKSTSGEAVVKLYINVPTLGTFEDVAKEGWIDFYSISIDGSGAILWAEGAYQAVFSSTSWVEGSFNLGE